MTKEMLQQSIKSILPQMSEKSGMELMALASQVDRFTIQNASFNSYVDTHNRQIVQLSVDGNKSCTISYTIMGNRIDWRCWPGSSDSGGLAGQFSIVRDTNNCKSVLKMHGRFLQSGRRKVLERWRAR